LSATATIAAPTAGLADEENFSVQRNRPYAESSGKPLRADVYTPRGAGPFPGVLVVHGGAWVVGDKAHMRHVCERLAQGGYVAVAINYRLAPLFPFPAQIEDCKAAVRWMRTQAKELNIDPERIGGFGYSAGGHLVALLGTTDAADGLEGAAAPDAPSTRLQCVVAGGAPCEFRQLPKDSLRLLHWFGGTPGDKPDLYALASPARFVSKDDPPVFFFHGAEDKLVPVTGLAQMERLLTDVGVPVRLYVIPGAGHVDAMFNERAMETAVKFLDEHLQQRAEVTTAPPRP
jgi:acetyl esterase/lipase